MTLVLLAMAGWCVFAYTRTPKQTARLLEPISLNMTRMQNFCARRAGLPEVQHMTIHELDMALAKLKVLADEAGVGSVDEFMGRLQEESLCTFDQMTELFGIWDKKTAMGTWKSENERRQFVTRMRRKGVEVDAMIVRLEAAGIEAPDSPEIPTYAEMKKEAVKEEKRKRNGGGNTVVNPEANQVCNCPKNMKKKDKKQNKFKNCCGKMLNKDN